MVILTRDARATSRGSCSDIEEVDVSIDERKALSVQALQQWASDQSDAPEDFFSHDPAAREDRCAFSPACRSASA